LIDPIVSEIPPSHKGAEGVGQSRAVELAGEVG